MRYSEVDFIPKKLRLEHPTFPSIQKTWFAYLESSDSGYSEYVLLVFVACVVEEKLSRPSKNEEKKFGDSFRRFGAF